MPIRAIVFDIGGVLEFNPRLGIEDKWERLLSLAAGELNKRLHAVWRAGSIGTLSLEEVHQQITTILGFSEAQLADFMTDIWQEYVGTLNAELTEYFKNLRPQYQTAILSNSFVGAREREQELYRFHEMTDMIIYSHEEGMSKPDPRFYALTCERLNVQPAEMIFVDDREDNIEAARALGIHAILFKDNAQVIAEIEACIQTVP